VGVQRSRWWARRILRAARGVRLLRAAAVIVTVTGIATRDGCSVLRQRAAGFALGLAGLTGITSAVTFALAEDIGENERVDSFADALWWSTTTITTVGYGDVYPTTGIGRLIAAFTMLVGISTFAVVTARIASFLVRDNPADPAT
jgi:voltage-gated potassium channel